MKSDFTHFKRLRACSPEDVSVHVGIVTQLWEEFSARFSDLRGYKDDFKLFTSPFDVDVESAPSEVQMELVDLQCSDELKLRFAAVGHADFWRKHILPTKRFPGLVDNAMRTVAAFGSTFCCEQLFSKIFSESKELVERNLEKWRCALEGREMKVSRSKTECMCMNERGDGETVLMQGVEVPKVKEFRYLGSTVQCNGGCGSEVKRRVQAGWNDWRRVSGVNCNRRLSACPKGKVYKTVVRPAMLYGLETVPLTKKQEAEIAIAELKMLRFSLGVMRMDKIKNEFIRGTAHVRQIGDKVREARLMLYGHVV